MQNMSKISTAGAGSITLRVAVGPRQFTADRLLAKADVTRAMHERVQLVSGPPDRICSPPPEFGSWPHQPHPASTRPHNPSGTAGCSNPRGWAAVSRTALGFTEDSMALSADQPGIGYKGARHSTAPAHEGALIAKPRIQVMIQDGVKAGLLPK